MLGHPTSLHRYRASMAHLAPLPAEEEQALAVAWGRGDAEAGRRIVEACLPFVISIAREYRRWGVPLEDLIQQGNLGLLKAAAKFEPERSCRLITYAVFWIRAEIRDYVVRSYRIVRLGATRTERRAMRAYRRRGVDSPEALVEHSGMPLARARALWPLLGKRDVSLDVRYEDREAPVDRLAGANETPEEALLRFDEMHGVRRALRGAMARLSDRERRIVRARLLSDEPRTLEALGVEMGVSKERVRQLEARARDKLRSSLAAFHPDVARRRVPRPLPAVRSHA